MVVASAVGGALSLQWSEAWGQWEDLQNSTDLLTLVTKANETLKKATAPKWKGKDSVYASESFMFARSVRLGSGKRALSVRCIGMKMSLFFRSNVFII